MDLATFNTCSPQRARALVLRAAAIAGWAEAVVAARPYPDLDAVIDHADRLAARWSDHDLEPLRSTSTCVAIRPTHRWITGVAEETSPDDEISETVLHWCRLRELALLRLQQSFDDPEVAGPRSTEVGHARSA